jgi:CRP/FNR family cyclic AMP-dependent transcriptional regulator
VPGESAADAWQIAQRCRERWPRSSFLAGLAPAVLRDFLVVGELVRFRMGDVLMREGDPSPDLFLLLDTSVKVTAKLDDCATALLAVRLGGDVVGELGVLDRGVRTATVSACEHAAGSAVRVGREAVHALLDRHPSAAVALAANISRKLRSATRRHVDSRGCTARIRLARAVLELAEDYGQLGRGGTIVSVNLTRFELGALVGVGETTAQRALLQLKKDGLVDDIGRRLLVPDVAALRVAAWTP